jgi:hypothetical protein
VGDLGVFGSCDKDCLDHKDCVIIRTLGNKPSGPCWFKRVAKQLSEVEVVVS